VPLRTLFIELEQDLLVRIPTCAGLLGDKLTAFAPNTVGIPCSESSAMQVMKQLFDVAELFLIVDDIEGIKRAYDALFERENGYRGLRYSRKAALQDSIETARRICWLRLRGAPPDSQSTLLDQGRRALESHLFGTRFSEAEMKIAAAKAAFLATMVLHQSTGEPMGSLRYSADMVSSLRSIELSDGVLQRLRDGVPEAFYYWSLVEQMQGRDDEA
jgi:hypothetical protein